MTMVASYLALGKLLAFPYLFLAGQVLTMKQAGAEEVLDLRSSVSTVASVLSLIAAAWLLVAVLLVPSYRRRPLSSVIGLGILQGLFAVFNELGHTMLHHGLSFELVHTVISIVRWSINGWVLVMAVGEVRVAAAKARRGKVPATAGVVALAAVAGMLGLAMTLPWQLSCSVPDSSTCLAVFLPYEGACGQSMKLVYLLVYSLLALLFAGCLLASIAAGRAEQRHALQDELLPPSLDVEPTTNAVVFDGQTCDDTCHNGFRLRLKVLLFSFALRSLFHVVFIASYYDDNSSCSVDEFAANHGGTSALLLMVVVLMVDGQAFTTCLLFGFQLEQRVKTSKSRVPTPRATLRALPRVGMEQALRLCSLHGLPPCLRRPVLTMPLTARIARVWLACSTCLGPPAAHGPLDEDQHHGLGREGVEGDTSGPVATMSPGALAATLR